MDIPDKEAELQKLIDEAKELLAPLKDQHAALSSLEFTISNEFDEQIKALQAAKIAKLQEHRDKKKAIASELQMKEYEAQQAVYKLRLLREEREREARRLELEAKEKADAEAEMLAQSALTNLWDKLTIGAPWRELAKDHQIKGAHKIVPDRNVILADPMGLGKTLTAIITCEMAERASKDASPENPWLGFEEEQYVPEVLTWDEKAYFHKAAIEAQQPLQGTPATIVKYAYPINAGDRVLGYIPYDAKQKLINEGFIHQKDAGYETVIKDAVTRPVGRRVLYLCPSSLLTNVLSEWRMWAPNRNATYIGGFPKVVRNMVLEQAKTLPNYVIVCNYEAWRKDKALLDSLIDMDFDTIIIDEAHNAKNRKSSVYKGIEALLQGAHRPEYVIPMTGTPILNKPEELYTLLYMVNPEKFSSQNGFLRDYCEQYEDNEGRFRWRFKEGGLDRVVKAVSANFLRRTKDQAGIDLPPKTIVKHVLPIDLDNYAKQGKAREHMRKYATLMIGDKGEGISATVKIALLTRLRQIETWPAGIIQYARDEKTNAILKDPKTGDRIVKLQVDVEESQKVDYVIRKDFDGDWVGLIPEAINDERMVLFSQFTAPLDEIARRVNASGRRAVVLNGSTPNELREQIRNDFDARYTPAGSDHNWDIVLCNYKVGGVGFNFTAASQLIALDEEWNPGKRDQAYDRIDRIGQTRPTTIHVIRMEKTIDDWLAGIIEEKENLVDGFQDAVTGATSGSSIKDALDSGLI